MNAIFLPGISTRLVADDLAGRGVGLDAVHEAIARLGYRPTVAFADGLARSLAWLDFAEGRA